VKKANIQVFVLVAVLAVAFFGIYFLYGGVGRASEFDFTVPGGLPNPDDVSPPDEGPYIYPGPDSNVPEAPPSILLPPPPGITSSCSLSCGFDGRNAVFSYSPKQPQCPPDFKADCDYAYTAGNPEFNKYVNSQMDKCCALPVPKHSEPKPEYPPILPGSPGPSAGFVKVDGNERCSWTCNIPAAKPVSILLYQVPNPPCSEQKVVYCDNLPSDPALRALANKCCNPPVFCVETKSTSCVKRGFIKSGSLGTKFENPSYADLIVQTPSPPCPPPVSVPYDKDVFTDSCRDVTSCGVEARISCKSGSFIYQSREDSSGFPCDNSWRNDAIYSCKSAGPLFLPLPGGFSYQTTLKSLVGDRIFNACCGSTGQSSLKQDFSKCEISMSFGACVYNPLVGSPPFSKSITISDSCGGSKVVQAQCTCSELLAPYGQCGSNELVSASAVDSNAMKIKQTCCK